MIKKISEFIYKNIPNAVTLSRGVLSPIILPILFFSGNIWGTIIATAVLGATDLIDGHLARTTNLVSNFGEKLDVVCDKILGLIALTLCCTAYPITILPTALELSIGTIGIIRHKKEKDKAKVVPIGKVKTVSLLIMVGFSFLSMLIPALSIVNIISLVITSGLQVVTLYENIKKLIGKEEIKNEVINEEKNSIEEAKIENKEGTIKNKYLALRNKIDYLVKFKEDYERSIGNKNAQRRLKK